MTPEQKLAALLESDEVRNAVDANDEAGLLRATVKALVYALQSTAEHIQNEDVRKLVIQQADDALALVNEMAAEFQR